MVSDMSNKHTTLDTLKEFLEKARRRLSDENPDYYEQADEEPSALEEDLSEGSEDDVANSWLAENDPAAKKPGKADVDEESAPEAPVERKPEPKKAAVPVVRRKAVPAATPAQTTPTAPVQQKPPTQASAPARTAAEPSEDALQPSREELLAMREYTRPWEQRARDRSKLEARPDVNPIKHHNGRIVEARSLSHADRQKAYDEFTKSPDYQNADPITQMEMDAKFHDDWKTKNPDHIKTALQAHQEAHKKGSAARELHSRAKDEKIRHIAGGAAQAGSYSVEEGLQHAGGTRDDVGDINNVDVSHDRSASFASGNREFLQDYMQSYDKRSKNFESAEDLDSLDNETRADIERVLGDHPALKDPAKKSKVDAFVAKYHPLIGKAAQRVVSKLGLSDHAKSGQIDYGLLHEAGMHALFQAVNDYDHDHASGAKFTTHLNRKMHGLMQTALKTQDEIPQEMRTGARKFDQQKRNQNAAPVKITDKAGNVRVVNPGGAPAPTPTPPPQPTAPPPMKSIAPVVRRASHEIASSHPPEVQDRLKRVAAAKQPEVRRGGATPPPAAPAAPKRNWNVRHVKLDEEE
jgi:hypothetical protein